MTGEKDKAKNAPVGVNNTADEVVKLLAAFALLLCFIGRLSVMDTAILLGLGFTWFTRTTTLGGKKK